MPSPNRNQDKRTAWADITRGRTKFILQAFWTPAEEDTFVKHLSVRGDPDSYVSDLLVSFCMPILKEISPETTVRDLTIEDFLHAPTYRLEIVSDKDCKEGIRVLGQDHCSEETAYELFPRQTSDIKNKCNSVPHILASSLKLAPCRNDLDNLRSLAGKVLTASGECMHFKPRDYFRFEEFDRELGILYRMRQFNDDHSFDNSQFRVSELRGLVVSGDKTVGFLLTLIKPHALGMHPLEKGFCGRFELHKKWRQQVIATVQQLHDRGIVWGDVNPCNIVIDSELNAWVIDFGGNFNWEFVDEDNAETERGDWQGLERLFEDWLPSCRIWPSGNVGEVNNTDLI